MIDGYENLPANDESALMKAVAHQPVTAVVDSSSREFQLYESVKKKISLDFRSLVEKRFSLIVFDLKMECLMEHAEQT